MNARRLIVANWKMNGLAAEARSLASELARRLRQGDLQADVVLCPPFTTLHIVREAIVGSGIGLGAQDCHEELAGAFTGSISPAMLADAGCSYVILGHSERRHGLGETDARIARKVGAAWKAHLIPVLCVGETAAERDAGATLAVVCRQLAASLPEGELGVVIAYEPIWAIGTGRVPTPADIEAAHRALRAQLRRLRGDGGAIPILYGGSAKAANAGQILGISEVGGLLVGGASLSAGEFAAIAQAAR